MGHEWAIALLQQHIAHKNFRHAYLLTGPQGVGRRTLGLRFAQALNCPVPVAPGEPCLHCRTCEQIERMVHPDLAVVQAEQVGGALKVDQVRELQRSLSLAPYEAAYRIAILLRFEEANLNAANALLKTLEEPPSRVVLILTADSSESLLPTIVSRCEVLRLRPIPLTEISKSLQNEYAIPAGQALLLAHLSGGRPGYAIHLNRNPHLLEKRKIWMDDHHKLLAASRVDRFAYADKLVKDRESLSEALLNWLSIWRDVLLKASGASTPLTNLDQSHEIERLATQLDLRTAYDMVHCIEQTRTLVESNVNARLAMEVLLLDLPRI